MTPTQLAKSKSEHSEQRALFAWCAMASQFGEQLANDDKSYKQAGYAVEVKQLTPHLHKGIVELTLLFAIHNQGHGDAIRGAKAKAEGVKPGVPDLMLPISRGHYHGLFIEMKRETEGDESDQQVKWRNKLTGQGYLCCVCHGWKQAVDVLRSYLTGMLS